MIVKSGEGVEFTGFHRDGDIYILSIKVAEVGEISGEFTALEATSIIEGLTDMLLTQVIKDSEKEIEKNGEN